MGGFIVQAARAVTGGIDTHGEVHVAAALDEVGGLLGTESFHATPKGYSALLSWLVGLGAVGKVGVEGTGSYGAGLARFLARAGVEVIEVDRHNRQDRRRQGKSDPIDAVQAARAALSGRVRARAKSRDGAVEAIRVLMVAKRSARQARVKALTQMRQLTVVTGMISSAVVATSLETGPSFVDGGHRVASVELPVNFSGGVGPQSESWELGSDNVCHVTPTHISSDDPSPNVTKCGGALRRIGSSCASSGS
jgi:hypothetical protein